MRYLICALLWLACGSGGALAAGLDLGRYYALVIGINDYEYLPKLKTAVNDASAVHDLLSREYGYHSTLLLNPTRQQIIVAFDKLRAQLDEDDNLLIFYAGHGILDRPTGEGFWLSVKATSDSQVEWLPISTVTRLLKATLARHALVVVDSCYSGTLTRGAPIALATGPAREAELERLAAKRARKALTSGGLEPVNDGGGDGHSVFTRALLETLEGNHEVLDGYRLFSKIRAAVVLNARQTPEYADIRMAGDEGGDFLFAPLKRKRSVPAAAGAPAPAGPDKEVLFWQAIQDSRDAADYRAYLEQYPDGAFAALARTRARRYAAAAAPRAPAPRPQATQKPAAPAPKPQVALVAPAQPATAADGKWRLSVKASSFSQGDLGGYETVVDVEDGRFKSGLVTHDRLRLWVSFEIADGAITGSLTLAPDSEYNDATFKIHGAFAGDAYEQRVSVSALRRTMGGYSSEPLDVVFRLERAK